MDKTKYAIPTTKTTAKLKIMQENWKSNYICQQASIYPKRAEFFENIWSIPKKQNPNAEWIK